MSGCLIEAVTLAASEERWFHSLTILQPKPTPLVVNRSVAEYALDALFESGIERVVVVGGHRADHIQSHLSVTYPDTDIGLVHQDTRLGGGHALLLAEELVTGPFVICNGGNVVNADIVLGVFEHSLMIDSMMTITVAESDTLEEYGITVEGNGRIADVDEHVVDGGDYLVNAGVYVFDDVVFRALRHIPPYDDETRLPDVIRYLDGHVMPVLVNSGWLDPPHPRGLLSATGTLPARRYDNMIAASTRVYERVPFDDHTTVNDSCDMGPGAIVSGGSCLQSNVSVGANGVIERSILSTDAQAGVDIVLRDSVAGSDAVIGDGAVSSGGRADVTFEGRLYTDRRLDDIIGDRAEVGAGTVFTVGSRAGVEAVVDPGMVSYGGVRERVEVTH